MTAESAGPSRGTIPHFPLFDAHPFSENNLTLLAELRRRAPQAIDWAGMQDVVPLLDAFETARESETARRH